MRLDRALTNEPGAPPDGTACLMLSPELRAILRGNPHADAEQVAIAISDTMRQQIIQHWDQIRMP